jgi:hypothetical protein
MSFVVVVTNSAQTSFVSWQIFPTEETAKAYLARQVAAGNAGFICHGRTTTG